MKIRKARLGLRYLSQVEHTTQYTNQSFKESSDDRKVFCKGNS